MSLKKTLLLSASISFSMALALPAFATSVADVTNSASAPATSSISDKSKDNTPVTHAEFKELLKETLMNNPEIIMESVKKLREKSEAEAKKKMEEAMAKHKDALVNDTKSPSVGDPKITDTTIVQFFDYHCGYCKRMIPVISQIIKEDKKVRFLFREFPILSEDSVLGARAALAVNNIDKAKYFDFHVAMMKHSGKFDEKSLADIAKKVGIDEKKLKKEMENPDITKALDENREIAEELNIRGTPAIILDGVMLPGAVPHDDLVKMIANVRKGLKPDASLNDKEADKKEPEKKDTDAKEGAKSE